MNKAELTDEQIEGLWREVYGYCPGLIARRDAIEFARAIEAAHGIGVAPSDDGPIMRRGSRGDGSDWMGTMRECLEDAQEAARVEAALGDEARAEVKRLRALLDAAGVKVDAQPSTVDRLRALMAEAAATPGKAVELPPDLAAELSAESAAQCRAEILAIRQREYMPSRDGGAGRSGETVAHADGY